MKGSDILSACLKAVVMHTSCNLRQEAMHALRPYHACCAGADCAHWIGNREGPVPDAELLSLLKEVELSGVVSSISASWILPSHASCPA